jgi:hypothetical protein
MSSARLAALTFGLKLDVPVPALLDVVPELVAVPGPLGCGPKQNMRRPRETWICLSILEQIGFWSGFGTNLGVVCASAAVGMRTKIRDATRPKRTNRGTALVCRVEVPKTTGK